MSFKAEIVADSINEGGKRLTTFVVVFPRMVLAEFNTHRMLSRNSASSRAVPFEKMLKRVQENPFIPMKWMKDHKGMQGVEYFDPEDITTVHSSKGRSAIKELETDWLLARDQAISQAMSLSKIGLTKQIVNRLLEPFMWHTVIVTATEWENFFSLRAHEAAEIHIQHLAYMMLEEYNKNTPKLLKEGDWHIPFGDRMSNGDSMVKLALMASEGNYQDSIETLKVKIATARCARVSYINYEGKDDYQADVKLHDALSEMGHWSPFEHCAKAMETNYFSGNFCGFEQYRKEFVGENKKDERVKSKYNVR